MYSFGYHIVCCITLALLAKGTMGQYAPRDVPVGAASLAFVFDTTGSMFDDLVQVIAGAKKILNTTLARREKPLYNYVLVPFHDPDIGPVLVTTDPSEFQEVLGSLYVQGGQDCPEMSIGAISEALDVTLPNSFIYVFTDASAKDYQLTDVVLAQIQQKHSQIVFVLTGDCGDPTHEGFRAYETVASTSSGQVFLLHKNQVNKILEFVEVAVQARKVNLMSVDVQDSGTRTFDVPIDSNIQEFTVSVSGDDPLIQLVNPSGQIVDVYRGLHELLSLSTAKVVNVKDPEDGVWELSIVSSSPHTIRVTGLSSTDFVAGFARKLDGKTELRPLGGVPSYVMINASDLDPPGGFTNLELVNIYGEILEFHDLRRNEINPNFYTTESPFVPPVGFFYIKLTGIDKKNYNLVRLTPTALSSRPPPKPYVYLPPITRGFYDTTATILCAVQSPIPFSVRWHKDGVPIGDEQFFGESSNVLLEIPYATRQVEGRYYCNATNIAGYNATVTFLDITEPPPDIQPMWNVTVLPGEHTRMDCIVHSTVEYNITWYHPKSQDFIKTGKKYSVFNNGSLLIHNVGMDDEGRYVCVASNEGGMTEGLVHLRVKVQPKAQIQPETKNFKNGETVNLTCTAEGYPEPTFYWLRDDQVLLPTERIRISGQHLSIGNMFSGDQGAYQCLAENSAGEDIVTALLTYIEPPIITEAVQKVLVASGDNATLVCLANGIPPPKITWFRGDVQLRPLSYVDITETGRLTIIGTQTQDAGIYTCVATNEAGSDSTMVELEVGSDPRILIGPDSEGIDIGTNATLECVAEGSPKPKIYWKDNDGNMIILGGRFLQLQSGSLFIMNLQPEDEGKYTCVAQNQFGIQEMTSFVTVTGILRPVIAFTNPYIEIKQGEELELHCVLLQGNPQPRVQWLRYSSRIKEDEHVNRTGPGHIFISNIQQKHEGEYVCLASNVAGNSTFGVTVDVQVPPNLETDVEGNTQTEFTVFEGESITLPCSTDGDPKPVIMWFKDGVEISLADPAYFITESGGLEIFGAEAQNAGSYMCVASNVAGEISKTVKLFVEVSPTIQGLLEEEKTVIKGETVLMSCVAEGTPKPEMSWRRNFIPFTHENGRFTENDRGLTISSVTLEDKAIYECVATNVAGEATKVITLIVQIPPTISEEGETEIIVHKGDLVTLNCDSEGEPEPLVTWTKNAQILDLFSNVHLLVDTKGSLTITDAKETDDGLYICTADNGAGTAKKEFSVTVHASPTLPDGLRDKMDIIEGNDVILECPATGKPKPVVQWFKNDREIRASEPGVNFLSDGSLELLSTEARDSGAYRCVATNVAGEIDHDVNLKVLIPPKVIGGQRGDIPIPESHTVVVNQSLTLRCTVEADPPPVIQWKRNDRLITEDMFNSGALSVSEDGKELTIEHSEVEDSGKYSCVATNVAGQSEKNFVVEVHVPPFIDESTASLRNLSVIINNPLTIACPVIGVPLPQILWYKNGEYISPSLDPNIQLHGGGRRLEISGARISDAAGYRCVGKNIAGHTFKDYDVSVYIPPTIEESDIRGTFEVKENFPLTLVCHASGIPRPEITWYKRGLPVENGTRYLILNDGSHLQIPSAMLDDASIFTCKAENVAGAIEKKYDVNVLVEAFIPREDIDLTVDVVINRTMTLNCPAQGNPLPEITWYKNNIIIDSSARSRYEIVSEGRQLLVKNAALSDTATYSCEAINKAGKDRIDFNAEVLVPSKIQLPNVNTNPKVVVNSSLVLDCPATGTPPPVITWFKDNQEISGTSLPNVRILQGGRQIELTNIQTSDTGRYKCRASNTAGTSELNYNVNVQVPPSITSDVNTSPNVIVNNPVTIYCPAEGTPLPNIAWSKNGEPIVEDGVNYIIKSGGRELTIQSASVQDTGRYTCTASNEAGSSRKDYDLDVYVPPKIADTYDKLTKVIRGRSTVLSCPASGTPTPVIEWSHNGEQVAYSDKILALDGGRTLQFFDSQVKNSGNYRCLATNVAGRDYADMELMVLVPPSIDESNAVYTPKVIQNRTVLLECAVSGVPQPEVQWLVNDRPLAASDRISFHNQNTLVQILDSKVTDTSTYTCQATNEAGQLRKNFQLQIIVPPVIDQTVRRNFTVVEGGTINIDCPVSGIPLPSITWLKERTALTSFPYTDITLTNGNQRIIIRNAKLEDAVKYSCRAVNPAGRTTMDFYLRVYVRPVIEDTEDDEISALEGEMVTLECPVVGIPDPIIQWQKDNRVIELSHNSHIQILAGGQVLRLQGVSVTDAAQYKCHAENEAGWAEKLFQLQVLVAPRIIGSNRLQQMEVVLGNDLELTCQVQGVPTPDIVWIWQGSPIAQSSRFFQRSEGGQRLTVVDADLPQAGNYTCLAQNLAGLASLNYTVSVLVPPKITDDVKQVIGTLNEQATLPCEYGGVPAPTVSWMKNGEPFPLTSLRHQMIYGSLMFSRVRLEDEGRYQCVISNSVGNDTKFIDFLLQVPPTIVGDSTVRMNVIEGSSAFIPCEAEGRPEPTIQWNKGFFSQLRPGTRVLPNGTLWIQSVEGQDSGIYRCVASNVVDLASKTVRLRVLETPRIPIDETEYSVQSGDRLILPCRARGRPRPSIQWMKNGRPLDVRSSRYYLQRHRLVIAAAREEDAGNYTCTASNTAGDITVYRLVTVLVPPHIEEARRLITGYMGNVTTEVPCEVTGQPRPVITWYKDRQRLQPNPQKYIVKESGTLVIRNLELLDSGLYRCEAVNIAGNTSQEITIRVQVPPTITLLPQSQEVTVGGRIQLLCGASGIPTPVIRWTKNGSPIQDSQRGSGRSLVIIKGARVEDAGMYQCIAENPAGSDTAAAQILLSIPPQVSVPEGNAVVSIAEKVILTCSVGGDPRPKITWTKNGRPVELNERIQLMSNGSLVIYDATSSDAGDYKCVASNEAGTSEGVATLIVNEPPHFKIEPKNMTINQGDTLTMDCVAEGEPLPTISWQKSWEELVPEGRLSILPNNSLRILAIQVKDSGLYQCKASNREGITIVDAYVTVVVHGMYSKWSDWGPCSTSCGIGLQFRTRTCTDPAPVNGGRKCIGASLDSKTCLSGSCPVDGNWGNWQSWAECSSSCGAGQRTRIRECDNPPPQYDGEYCDGDYVEVGDCNQRPCPVNGGFSLWSDWGPCDVTCGMGFRERTRMCDNPVPKYGGIDCYGDTSQRQSCSANQCAVDGNWGSWTNWSPCSQSCGGGSRTKTRECNDPEPQFGGIYCVGRNRLVDYCNPEPCPVHGSWSPWESFGACSASCGGGIQKRFRTCTNPAPSQNGRRCPGSSEDVQQCNTESCLVPGFWSDWSDWSVCSVTCGEGSKERRRRCNTPRFGGMQCEGQSVQRDSCSLSPCTNFPTRAEGNLVGYINNIDLTDATINATIVTTVTGPTEIRGMLNNLPPAIGSHLRYLMDVLNPIYWATAHEINGAKNGFSLTKGNIVGEVQVNFATGEVLKMSQYSRGVDSNGVLQIDVIVFGNVPNITSTSQIQLVPFTEQYIQTGPETIYAQSSRLFRMDDTYIPYAWNRTVTYSDNFGLMPNLVQDLYSRDFKVLLDPTGTQMHFSLAASISPGDSNNMCPEGFHVDDTGTYCRDIDECLQLQPCSHHCHNSPGTYACSCPFGFMLQREGHTCEDINECNQNNGGCLSDQECINTLGSHHCAVICEAGFRRSLDDLRCDDIDECHETPEVCGQTCTNTRGSYHCSCSEGFRLLPNGRCTDVNECQEGQSRCSHICRNKIGTYKCACPAGLRLRDQFTCVDIDECAENSHRCYATQRCANTQGSYQCEQQCQPGYQLNALRQCQDLDECRTNRHMCHATQQCINTDGSYTCTCQQGYRSEGPGRPCIDINECIERRALCSFHCRNIPGSFECVCAPGQILLADKKSCAGLEYLEPSQVLSVNDQHELSRTQTQYTRPCNQGYGHCRSRYRRTAYRRLKRGDKACLKGMRYIASQHKCIDINECRENLAGCQHNCTNSLGSFRCTCPNGYRVGRDGKRCVDIDECLELDIKCGEEEMCFNTKGDYRCISTPCPPRYHRSPFTGYCILECEDADTPCPPGASYADIIEFRNLALSSGIQAYQDLLRLIAYNQDNVQLKYTNFTILKNDEKVAFNIRLETGTGIIFPLEDLQETELYSITVRAQSYDHTRINIQYKTTFMVHIAVSAFPY